MEISAVQIAEWIDGKIIGNKSVTVSGFAKIEEATASDLTFLANPKYKHFLKDCKAGIILINEDMNIGDENKTYIQVPDAYLAVTKLLNLYDKMSGEKTGKEEPCFISSSAELGENLYIGAFSYIGENVKIGNNVKIYPNTYIADNSIVEENTVLYSGVKIYKGTEIGKSCIIHSGTVIGSDGFGFQPDEKGVFHKVAQIGNVVIEDNVEIGACCTIDRATIGSTVIKKGVKLDNQIQIAHNVVVGKNTVIASQSGVAGSTKIGENNLIGGQVGITGHLTIGNNVQIQAQSGVNKNTEANSKLYGSPAINAMDFRKSYIYFRKLPQIVEKIDKIEKDSKS